MLGGYIGQSIAPATESSAGLLSAADKTKLDAQGIAATHAATDFAQIANNLSDLASVATARTNLGLGSAATTNSSAYDAAGAAATAQAASLQKASNLSDLVSAATARTNLGLGTAAVTNTGTANGNVPVISGGVIPSSIIPTLNQNTTGTAANVTGTVAIGNGGTGATTAAAALTNLGALSLAGGTMTGAINMGGKGINNLSQIVDHQSPTQIRISTGGSTGTGDTQINDSSGSTQIDVSTSGVSIPTSPLNIGGGIVASGQLIFKSTTFPIELQNSFGSNIATMTAGAVWKATDYQTPSFSSPKILYVDPVNGNDSSPSGSMIAPYQSITGALAHAVSGNLILVAPGIYNIADGQLVLPAGVHLKGFGIDVTIIQGNNWVSGQSGYIVPGNGSVISDLTIDMTVGSGTGSAPACIGCNDVATGGSQQLGLSPSLYRVKCINNSSAGLYYFANNSTSATPYLRLEDCVFISNGHPAQWYLTGDTNFSVDAFRCQFNFIYSSSFSNTNGECVFPQAKGTSRFFDCLFSMTDTVHTSWSGLSYQGIDADSPVEIYGCHLATNFPNLPAIVPVSVAGTNPGFMFLSNTLLTKIGGGNTFSLPDSDAWSQSLYQMLPSPKSINDVFAATVASSAITPYGEANGAVFTVAVDAGTLTSNTLTINNVAVGNNAGGTSVALTDGQEIKFRIKNTNASSTAMTIALGTTYNLGATSLSTIAAGKTAYIGFTYNAVNSKWDLSGYSTGL